MTFLDSIKNEMVATPPKKNCCKRNLLWGMLCAKGSLDVQGRALLRLSNRDVLTLAQQLVKEQLSRTAELLSPLHGGRVMTLSFESSAAKKILEQVETQFLAHPIPKQCPHCSASFLKGVFLAAGHLTNPQKAYHLEFSLGERAEAFLPIFKEEYAVFPRLITRKNERLLYLKDSTAIEDMMTVLGINDAAFLFMNCKIEKQFRNEANRRANCEAGNITRTVNAAAKILAALRRMEARGAISALPEELSVIAQLRLAYPEASLSQLASLTTPPLTKSGVNHRLQKIMEIAEKQEAVSKK